MICSVSPVLDCGHTLVGGRKVVQLVCENKGGDGKFCIMRKSHWPSTTFQVLCMKCSLTLNVHYKASSMSGQEEPCLTHRAAQENSARFPYNNLLIKLVRSRWLGIGLNRFVRGYGPPFHLDP